MPSPRSATAIRAVHRARSREQAQPLQLPDQRGADGGARRARRNAWCASRSCRSTSVFFVNSGAEANENALKIALRMTGRAHVVAVEGSFHGRTAAAGAVTWGARAEVVRLPAHAVRRELHPARRPCRARRRGDRGDRGRDRRAGAGRRRARSTSAPTSCARCAQRCDDTGALLIFDEVQCGIGRTGAPVRRQPLRRARPTCSPPPRRSATASRARRCCCRRRSPRPSSPNPLGTTFGGGPMACAAIEAVHRGDRVTSSCSRRCAASAPTSARHCIVGPVTGAPGRGLAHRPAHRGARRRRSRPRCSSATSSPAPASDPHILRLLPPFILEEEHVDMLRDALSDLDRMKRFLDLADFTREEVLSLLALARRLEKQPGAARARRQDPGAGVLQPLAAHARLVPGRRWRASAAARSSSPRARAPGSSRPAPASVMDGAAAEHVREGIPVLASYCDALGIRAFAEGKDLAADLAETSFNAMAEPRATSR